MQGPCLAGGFVTVWATREAVPDNKKVGDCWINEYTCLTDLKMNQVTKFFRKDKKARIHPFTQLKMIM